MHRAYALLDVKAFDEEQRIIEGIATTPTPDRGGDILEPAGAQFTLPIPLLWQHDQTQPIGEVFEARVTPAGIAIKARIARVDEPGRLKDRVDEAWHSLKAHLVRGLSVGWKPLEALPIKGSFGIRAVKWIWAELSAVTIPQNVEATIFAVKSAAAPARKETPMTTVERITALENSRAAKVGRLATLMEKATAANVTIAGGPDAEEYDGLELDVKNLDADLTRLRTLEMMNKAAAVAVTTPTGPKPSSVVQVKANVPPGTVFVRYIKALAACRGSRHEAIEYAQEQWKGSTPEVALMLKAAVAAGNTTDATWAGPLAPFKPLMDEFLDFLRPATIVDRVRNFRNVPFNCSVPSQTGGGTYGWVGQGAPKPVGKLQFGTTTLGITKLAGIIAITEELARSSSPSAEDLIRNDMIKGIAQVQDLEFIDPAKAPVTNVSPGSVTNGVTPITSAGTSPANGRTDVLALLGAMATAGLDISEATLIMSQTNALTLGAGLNPLGQALFPGLGVNGGSILGVPVIPSQTAASWVIAVHAPSILKADDGGVTIDVSREASVQMDSAPDNPALATTVFTSFWQSNLVGLRGERFINWKKVRAGSVQFTVQTYVG